MTAQVTIHAPAWGATDRTRLARDNVTCFNPRARVGRDEDFNSTVDNLQSFNPRARVGRDRRLVSLPLCYLNVSIHAPAWGATFI